MALGEWLIYKGEQLCDLIKKKRPWSVFHLFYGLNHEGEGTEAIIAADEGRMRILHPSIIEVSPTLCQFLHKCPHRLPSTVTEIIGLLPIDGDKLLSQADIACMLYGILVLLNKIRIASTTKGGDSYVHECIVLTIMAI